MGVSWIFLYEAYQQIGVSIASLAYYCGPVIVMLLFPLLLMKGLRCLKLEDLSRSSVGFYSSTRRLFTMEKHPGDSFVELCLRSCMHLW